MDRRNIIVDVVVYRGGTWFGTTGLISSKDDNYLDLMKRAKLEEQWESLCHEEMKRMGCLWDDPEAL